jgi:hypothetical protein
MELSDKDVDEFVGLYKQRFGNAISREEAEKFGRNLVHLVKMIYKPIKKAGSSLPKAEP